MSDRTTKFCTECGAEINVKAEICPKCGVRQMAFGSCNGQGSSKRVTAGLLALLLGGLGVHHFYLKNIGRGILYLLFFWTCIPAIAALIEGIIWLTMSDNEFTAKYGI